MSRGSIRSRDPVAIVGIAIADHGRFEHAIRALRDCEPSAAAAQTLMEAHDAGQAPSWLTACLLGHVRHRSGLPRVLQILRDGDRFLSESYAAQAAVMIAGDEAELELGHTIDAVDDGTVRKAAAYALGRRGTERAMALLVAAIDRGRLRSRTVAVALAYAQVDPEAMADAITAGRGEARRWPAMLIAERLRSSAPHHTELERCARSPTLRRALTVLLTEGEPTVMNADAARIRAWLETAP